MFGNNHLTRDDVLWCYRTILRREPESEAVVTTNMRSRSLRDVVQAFLESPEYRTKVTASLPPTKTIHPLNIPRAHIDVHLVQRDMAAAIGKVKATWSGLGETRAHHSVLTDDKYRPENLAGSLDAFWASGEGEVAIMLDLFRHHGLDPKGKVCVEYGCGVGRATAALAKHFGTVYAYDISANHLAHARERFERLQLTNVITVECSETFLEELQPCDAFYSRIVFQHNPPPIIRALIRMSLRALKPNGIAIFQVPVYQANYAFNAQKWLAAPKGEDMEMHCIPQADVFAAIAAENCIPLEVREDEATGSTKFISNTFVARKLY